MWTTGGQDAAADDAVGELVEDEEFPPDDEGDEDDDESDLLDPPEPLLPVLAFPFDSDPLARLSVR
ncbi:hypothetical protein GTS_51340 [Gandjariella thermophila]|uniref:Uncharacterized protein n=1 Tax=Gandjariella thermophila TaxID=1931992 RepID=A0A4D4JA05_9PSEU|nr:hypothetical protein GTS_51340 [Gandjariella thermophila]